MYHNKTIHHLPYTIQYYSTVPEYLLSASKINKVSVISKHVGGFN